jgi:hypothetical protein
VDKIGAGSSPGNPFVIPPPGRVYCRTPGEKFTIEGTVKGKITVIAGEIEVNTVGALDPNLPSSSNQVSSLEPFNDAEPVLFYTTKVGAPDQLNLTMNPSGRLDWSGIQINSGNVKSPRQGLLEAHWILVNGANFTMLGTFSGSSSGSISGAPALEE